MPHRFDRVSFIAGLVAIALGLWALVDGPGLDLTGLPWRFAWPVALFFVAIAVLTSLRPERRSRPEPAPPSEPIDPLVAEALRELDGPGFDPLDFTDTKDRAHQ